MRLGARRESGKTIHHHAYQNPTLHIDVERHGGVLGRISVEDLGTAAGRVEILVALGKALGDHGVKPGLEVDVELALHGSVGDQAADGLIGGRASALVDAPVCAVQLLNGGSRGIGPADRTLLVPGVEVQDELVDNVSFECVLNRRGLDVDDVGS